MKLFASSLSSNEKTNDGTTAGFFFGDPEAEAEALNSSKIRIHDVFVDVNDLESGLESSKFIIIGRKGCGKSAFAKYLEMDIRDRPNIFFSMIKGNITLGEEALLQSERGANVSADLIVNLFEWIIWVRLVRILVEESQVAYQIPAFKKLGSFLSKNSGYARIDTFNPQEIMMKTGGKVDVKLLRQLSASMGREVSVSGAKASFYQLIPDLRESVLTFLKDEMRIYGANSYVIMIDDLDVGYSRKNIDQKNAVIGIFRKARELNEIFDSAGVAVKVLAAIRDDIADDLLIGYADSAKLIHTYGIRLNWFDPADDFYKDSINTKLRRFINKRIESNFITHGLDYDRSDPWSSLFVKDLNRDMSNPSFKRVIDATFMRPRDLILFMKPISEFRYRFPIDSTSIQNLIQIYTDSVMNDIFNEWSIHYEAKELVSIQAAIKYSAKQIGYNDFKMATICDFFAESGCESNCEEVVELLFYYSMIGTKKGDNDLQFRHRAAPYQNYVFDKDSTFVFHYPVRVWAKRN